MGLINRFVLFKERLEFALILWMKKILHLRSIGPGPTVSQQEWDLFLNNMGKCWIAVMVTASRNLQWYASGFYYKAIEITNKRKKFILDTNGDYFSKELGLNHI